MNQPEVIKIDDVEYVRRDSLKAEPQTSGEIRIVVLQRGWVMVGYFSQDGPNCTLMKASCIRKWGTTKGLGEIAYGGPTKDTVIDPCPPVHFHELTIIQTIDCPFIGEDSQTNYGYGDGYGYGSGYGDGDGSGDGDG